MDSAVHLVYRYGSGVILLVAMRDARGVQFHRWNNLFTVIRFLRNLVCHVDFYRNQQRDAKLRVACYAIQVVYQALGFDMTRVPGWNATLTRFGYGGSATIRDPLLPREDFDFCNDRFPTQCNQYISAAEAQAGATTLSVKRRTHPHHRLWEGWRNALRQRFPELHPIQ